MSTIAAVLVLLFLLGVGGLWGWSRRKRDVAELQATAERLTAEHSRELQQADDDRDAAQTELARATRVAREYREFLAACVDEANKARDLYVRMGAAHGAAQAMMLTERSRLIAAYLRLARLYEQQTKKQAPPLPQNQIVEQAAAEFRETHGLGGSGPRALTGPPDPSRLPPVSPG